MGVSFDFISTIFQLDVGTLRMVWNVLCFFMVVRIDDRDGSKSSPHCLSNKTVFEYMRSNV
jgi:hypothetical protein